MIITLFSITNNYWLLLFFLFFLGKVLYWCWDVSSYNRRALASFMMMWIFLVTLGPRLHTSPSTSFCGALMHDIDINMGQYGSFHFSEGQKECKNLTQTGPYSIWHINSTLRKCTVSTVLNLLNTHILSIIAEGMASQIWYFWFGSRDVLRRSWEKIFFQDFEKKSP